VAAVEKCDTGSSLTVASQISFCREDRSMGGSGRLPEKSPSMTLKLVSLAYSETRPRCFT